LLVHVKHIFFERAALLVGFLLLLFLDFDLGYSSNNNKKGGQSIALFTMLITLQI
jgi:hypothetical protein